MTRRLQRARSAFVVAVTMWALYVFVEAITVAPPAIKAAIIGGLLSVGVALWTQNQIKKREQAARLHDRKREAYGSLVDILFGVLQQQGTRRGVDHAKAVAAMRDCKKQILLWGGHEFIRKWARMEEGTEAITSDRDKVLVLESVLRMAREDLGHDDSALAKGELIGLLLTSEARDELLRAKERSA